MSSLLLLLVLSLLALPLVLWLLSSPLIALVAQIEPPLLVEPTGSLASPSSILMMKMQPIPPMPTS